MHKHALLPSLAFSVMEPVRWPVLARYIAVQYADAAGIKEAEEVISILQE